MSWIFTIILLNCSGEINTHRTEIIGEAPITKDNQYNREYLFKTLDFHLPLEKLKNCNNIKIELIPKEVTWYK